MFHVEHFLKGGEKTMILTNRVNLHNFTEKIKMGDTFMCFTDTECKFYLVDDLFMNEITDMLPWEKITLDFESNLIHILDVSKKLKSITTTYNVKLFIKKCIKILSERCKE